MQRRFVMGAAFALTVLTACASFERGMEGHEDIVAQVDGYSLTVDHAAALLAVADPATVPMRPATVDRLVQFWIGYTALASEMTRPDTLAGLSPEPLIAHDRDQELVWRLQEQAILANTTPPDENLRASYEREQPYTRVEAQHILIRVPANADSAVTDSLRRRAERIRERAVAGEDFGELARRYSDDPSTASRGGSLGTVERGQLVDPVERAIFSLEPGEISETVRSSFGYHIIRVISRESPSYDEMSEDYRTHFLQSNLRDLETAYIDSLFEAADVRYVRGFVPLVKQLSILSRLVRLSPAERASTLVDYDGGELTLGEWADFVISNGQSARTAFASRDSAQVVVLLHELVRNELLVKAARDEGIRLDSAAIDSLLEGAHRNLHAAALSSGLRKHLQTEGVSLELAVDRALAELLTSQRGPRPVERIYPALIAGRAVQVNPGRFNAVLARLQELRKEGPEGERAPEGVPKA